MTKLLPTAGKYCVKCGEIHHVAYDILCTICRPIMDYEARAALAAITYSAEPSIKTFPTPDEGGPEFKFARAAADRFRNKTILQAQKGFLKYNKELDPNADYDWLSMAEEEVADLWQYLQCERVRRDEEQKYLDQLEGRVKKMEDGMKNVLSKLRSGERVYGGCVTDLLSELVDVPERSENAVSGQVEGDANE